MKLTNRQRCLLRGIRDFVSRDGMPCEAEDLAESFDKVQGTKKVLTTLQKRGLVRIDKRFVYFDERTSTNEYNAYYVRLTATGKEAAKAL